MRRMILMAAMMTVAGLAVTPGAGALAADGQAGNKVESKTESKAANKPADPAYKELRSIENPHIKIVEDKARALVAPLTQAQMQDLYIMRDGYGILQSVNIVVRDVGNAVRLCGEDNPDLKKDMDARYKKWETAVSPVLKDNMAKLQKTIDQQTFTSPKMIRDYFKALDDATAYAEKKFDKRVVTTPEACNKLRDSMDDTQGALVKLLGEMRFVEAAKKAEAAPDAKQDGKQDDKKTD